MLLQNANLDQIRARLKRAPGEVHLYLKRLAEIDLVRREGRCYTITDPIIALWLRFAILERTPEYGAHKDAVRRYQDRRAERTAWRNGRPREREHTASTGGDADRVVLELG